MGRSGAIAVDRIAGPKRGRMDRMSRSEWNPDASTGCRSHLRASADPPARPTIADRYADLLSLLDDRQRRSVITQLAVGYYEGWRPTRGEVSDLVALKLGILSADQFDQRQRHRRTGHRVVEVAAITAARRRFQN